MESKKVFRAKLNFSKEELQRAQLGVDHAGVSIAMPDDFSEYKKQFSSTKDWLQFGQNDSTFYGDMKAKDIMPKPSDFIEAPFRLISATTVGAGSWKATDFSDVAVLKASVSKLEGKPLYKDHQTNLDNWVGLVKGVKWTAGFDNGDGVKVPAGIDGIVAIDAKTNPKVARGVLMGSIFSNSVTVEFDWKMSHAFEDEYEFRRKIGTRGEDGEMIRRIVTQVFNYHESSLVWLGADPFAKAIGKDGKLKHIDTASIEYDKEKEDVRKTYEESNRYSVKYALDEGVMSLTKKSAPNTPQKKSIKMEKFIAAFVAKHKMEGTPTEAQMIAQLEAITTAELSDADKAKVALAEKVEGIALTVAKTADPAATVVDMTDFIEKHSFVPATKITAYEAANNKVTELTKEKKDLETKVTSLAAPAKLGREYLGMKRAEAIRLYKHTVGTEAVDAAVVALFEKAEPAEVEGLLKQYTKGVTHKFSGKCQDCGSTSFEFKSSVSGDPNPSTEITEDVINVNTLHQKYEKSSWNIGRTKE